MHAPVGQVQTRISGLLEIGYEWTYKRRPPTAFYAFDQESLPEIRDKMAVARAH